MPGDIIFFWGKGVGSKLISLYQKASYFNNRKEPETNISHVAMSTGCFSIVHAMPKNGVFLDTIYSTVCDSSQIKVYRNTDTFVQQQTESACSSEDLFESAKSFIFSHDLFKQNGIKYSLFNSVLKSNKATYCSKLVLDIFEDISKTSLGVNKTLLTPYELYKTISNKQEWADVTDIYRCYIAADPIPCLHLTSYKNNNLAPLLEYYKSGIEKMIRGGIFPSSILNKLNSLSDEKISDFILFTHDLYIGALKEVMNDLNVGIDIWNGEDVESYEIKKTLKENGLYGELWKLWFNRLSLGVMNRSFDSLVAKFILFEEIDKPIFYADSEATLYDAAKDIYERAGRKLVRTN